MNSSPLHWLYFDLNSYFASVEQQMEPSLRGKPVAVVPMKGVDSTCCLAASYEAKALGVKTGTNVAEARMRCPSIVFIEADHERYIRYHHLIRDAVESCIPVEQVMSIDEMACRLTGSQKRVEEAVAVSEKIKRTLNDQVGVAIKASIGLATNRFLAKVASDMKKPDGLTILHMEDVPQSLFKLKLRDLPGIGERMEQHLQAQGVYTIEQLCRFSREQMRAMWGGVWGERYHDWLHGKQNDLPETHRSTIGHSHVLEPSLRNPVGAATVAYRLLGKAAYRLRESGYWSAGLHLTLRFAQQGAWEGRIKLPGTQDTPTFLKALDRLWKTVDWAGKPFFVAVTLNPLISKEHFTPSLFENPKREKLSHVMDRINQKYGNDTAYYARLQSSRGHAPTRIAFSRIPSLNEF